MIRNINLENLQEVHDGLFSFIWNFKHGDNIMYNFEILGTLYSSRRPANQNILNKPITIQIVSIIEAILIDFLTRIDQATSHLPKGVDRKTLDLVKAEVEKDKKPQNIEDEFLGEYIYMRRKKYNYSEIVNILRKHVIFGPNEDQIYDQLLQFADMRNRVHIENYHGNMEDREQRVFTSARLSALEEVLAQVWTKMCADFKRPW